MEQAARGERAALQQRLTRLASALAQEGVEYSRLHALAQARGLGSIIPSNERLTNMLRFGIACAVDRTT